MVKPGPKPKGKVQIEWSPNFAYALGLLATDGNLSNDGRHFDFTSKDKEQLVNFMRCLGIKVKIGYKTSGYTGKKYTHIQFGDVNFYKYLLSIGFTPAKSKTLSELYIPEKYFFDFLRGHFDGDGSFYSYWDPRWRSSFMYYVTFISASKKHILWLQKKLREKLKLKGSLYRGEKLSCYQLRYAKCDSLKILKKMYHSKNVTCLSRKYLKIKNALSIVGEKF